MGAELLETEVRVLPKIRSHLPLPIPNPEFQGQPTGRFPWIFAGYRILKGATACSLDLDDASRVKLIPSLAEFLAKLHSSSFEWARKIGVPGDTIGRLDQKRRVPIAHERVDKLAKQGFILDSSFFHRLIDENALAREPELETLVHGDLYVRHLLVDGDLQLSGIIDWGDVHLGDVSLDLSIAYTFLPPKSREEFRREYGLIDDATWRLARFRAISYGLILTEYGNSVGDTDLAREADWILKSVATDT